MTSYTVGGRELDAQQTAAAVDDCPTKLVIAGAGTGKTTTLVGRLEHLSETGVDPDGVLVISLTNASVDDLKRKIASEMPGFRPDVMTIHALGNRILRKRPMVGAERSELLCGIINDLVQTDRRAARAMMAQVEAMRRSGASDLSYSGAPIRNRGLRMMADALFEGRVGFTYNLPDHRGQDPLPASLDVDDGRGHRFRLYSDDVPVSAASKDPASAREYIQSRNVEMDVLNPNDLASEVLRCWGRRIPDAVGAVISRCKTTGMTVHELLKRNGSNPPAVRDPVEDRLYLVDRVWDLYTLECISRGLSDYDDMVIQSAQAVRSGCHVKGYTHVLIDEYQDVSKVLVDLVMAMRGRMGFDLFCVGDDWQSIYGFSGGDVWQMVDFAEIWKGFGEVHVHRIEHTYRSPQQIVDVASKFIRVNRNQLDKEIKGTYSPGMPPVILLPCAADRDIPRMIANRIENLDPSESVFVIGRARNDIYALGNGNGQFLFSMGRDSGSAEVVFRVWDDDRSEWREDRRLRFLTAHSSKGLEADNVFVIADREHGGFPSQTSDDISDLFPVRDEGVPFAEERRVFYVAMTRARRRLFLVNMMEEDRYGLSSVGRFMSEIITENGPILVRSTVLCDECIGPMRIVKVGGRRFHGCCDYPSCRCTKPFYGL